MNVLNAPIETRGQPVVTHLDAMRLRFLVTALMAGKGYRLTAWLRRLDTLLKKASVLPAATIASDVVTMNSIVRLRDISSSRTADLELTFPADVGPTRYGDKKTCRRISVLSPMGLCLLGRSAGDDLYGRLVIDKILYQPEAAGEYEL